MIDIPTSLGAFSGRVMSTQTGTDPIGRLIPVVRKYWGFDTLRPLQAEAMTAVLEGRDSVVVLPTGGGKSLCFQVPAVTFTGVAIVVSPLLSLMKDQTDALQQCGIAAACLSSMQTSREQQEVIRQLDQGQLKLLYLAPERLTTARFTDLLQRLKPSFFAVDEAHCISSWGHEFRPDYRRLSMLRKMFPKTSIHAFTATATRRVRVDIAEHLALRNPEFHIGLFDRPNLTYRVERKRKKWEQICSVIEQHKGESGIIYCISRKNVEDLAASLREVGYKALPYHAGLDDSVRKRNQDAFLRETVDIIVATVAFGMGIDKSNVRYVLHAAAPKSIENYQQEAGRAGRDGLPADCVLLWGPGDFGMWRRIFGDMPPDAAPAAMQKLSQMSRYCESMTCRHQALVKYFGQSLDKRNCRACDVCLSAPEPVDDSQIIAQKILSCVVRLDEQHDAEYLEHVLVGSHDGPTLASGHESLSTFGILKEHDRRSVRDWIVQLRSDGYLQTDDGDSALSVTPAGWLVLRGNDDPELVNPRRAVRRLTIAHPAAESGAEEQLFEELRKLRKSVADDRNVPAFVIFSDAALLDMARKRPATLEQFLRVNGVGEKKCSEFGPKFIKCIAEWCHAHSVPSNDGMSSETGAPQGIRIPPKPTTSGAELEAYKLFDRGVSLEDVASNVKRAKSTVVRYLEDYLRSNQKGSPEPWVTAELHTKILESVERVGGDRLRPLFDDLDGAADYDQIRISLACLKDGATDTD
ncbi:MAG: DNA helicase RecQ [candidate division Zixibacteria bacterium]|nr:DNA helicase RecQ [candidate division Zixibacteria bacterium]